MLITPAAILWLLIAEIVERFKEPYGDAGLRSQEFVFGWLVVILIFAVGILLARTRSRRAAQGATVPSDSRPDPSA